jgi:hypothetical protein
MVETGEGKPPATVTVKVAAFESEFEFFEALNLAGGALAGLQAGSRRGPDDWSPLVLQLRERYDGGARRRGGGRRQRVDAGKTLALGPMGHGLAQAIRCAYTSSCIFPMGAVAKELLPGHPGPAWRSMKHWRATR